MSYSRIARCYHAIEVLTIGRALLDTRLAHLDALAAGPHIEHALLVGEGNGSFLVPFAQRFPDTKITVVDGSSEMLRVAQERLTTARLNSDRIEFQCVDLTADAVPFGAYDLIVTLFFFDNFKEPVVRNIVAALQQVSCPKAQWLLADFCIPVKGWRALRARIWLKVLYVFFGYFAGIDARTLPATEVILGQVGFESADRKSYSVGMLYSHLYQCG